MATMTREQWLLHAADLIRKTVAKAGVVVPPVAVSCSWPGGGSMHKRIGECWPRKASKAGINEVFITPKYETGAKVVAILCHELAHAVSDCKDGHRAGFVHTAQLMGCVGQPTKMEPPTAVAEAWAAIVAAKHGPYPHRTVDLTKTGVKRQTARMIKVECGDCGAVWRMARVHVERVAMCPCCGSEDIAIEAKG